MAIRLIPSWLMLLGLVLASTLVIVVLTGLARLLRRWKSPALGIALCVAPFVLLLLGGMLFTVRHVETHGPFETPAPGERWSFMPGRGRELVPETAPAAPREAPPPRTAATPNPVVEREPAEPQPRPAWAGSDEQRVGSAYQMTVATDPFPSRLECEADLARALDEAVESYVQRQRGHEAAEARQVRLAGEYVRNRLVKDLWEERLDLSVGPMVRLHALVQFDPGANAEIERAVEQGAIRGWIVRGATSFGIVLAVLAALWAYLRIDLATGGNFRWRLRFLAAAAILTVVGAGLAVVR